MKDTRLPFFGVLKRPMEQVWVILSAPHERRAVFNRWYGRIRPPDPTFSVNIFPYRPERNWFGGTWSRDILDSASSVLLYLVTIPFGLLFSHETTFNSCVYHVGYQLASMYSLNQMGNRSCHADAVRGGSNPRAVAIAAPSPSRTNHNKPVSASL